MTLAELQELILYVIGTAVTLGVLFSVIISIFRR